MRCSATIPNFGLRRRICGHGRKHIRANAKRFASAIEPHSLRSANVLVRRGAAVVGHLLNVRATAVTFGLSRPRRGLAIAELEAQPTSAQPIHGRPARCWKASGVGYERASGLDLVGDDG